MRKADAIRIAILCILPFLLVCAPAYAQDDYVQVYKFPKIEPELVLEGGYGFVSESGSSRAGKYRYLKSSPFGGIHLVAFPFPHRVYLEVEVTNKNDYFGDARYAYKDIILSRWLNSTIYHNLDNITLVDLEAPGLLDILRRDAGQRYWIKTGINKVFLRFKAPDFPFHVYLDGRLVEKHGTVQNRFLGGAGSFADPVRVSQKRDVNWDTTDITVGLNSHLGPIEADYSHTEKRYDSSNERLQAEAYTATPLVRPAGIYPHSLVSDIESSTDTLKLHTTYTGRIAASLTLLRTESENLDSHAAADYVSIAGDLKYMPINKLAFFFKYRHKERDAANPLAIPVGYLGFSSYTAAVVAGIPIRPLISTKSDSFSGAVRFRPSKWLTIRAGYDYKNTDRSNAVLWGVSPSTTENAFSLSVTAKLNSKLKLKGDYKFTDTDSPAYNIQPEDSHEASVSLTWNPVQKITAFVSYHMMRGDTDSIIIESTATGGREIKNDRIVTNLSFLLGKNFTLSTGYAYLRFSVEQDNIYGLTPLPQVVFSDIRYRDLAHNFTVSATYSPAERLRLGAGVSHTRSRSDFGPDVVGVATFTQLKVRETVYTASAGYRFPRGWDLEMNYEFTDFDDRVENVQNPTFSDGEAHIVFVSLSKKW